MAGFLLALLDMDSPTSSPPPIVTLRRDYNRWVASETLEDYALRFTPQRFRRWSLWQVANTAAGGAWYFDRPKAFSRRLSKTSAK